MFQELEIYKTDQDLSIKVTEIKVNLPNGEWISGKWWGDLNKKPILCLHGWLDNAGTFDRLIPLLSREFSYLSIDLPGHGRSSWLPQGVRYDLFTFVLYILKIMREYKWSSISLMSHSMGSGVSFIFTVLFPEKVDLLILFDYNKTLDRSLEQEFQDMRESYFSFLISDERNQIKTEPPSFTIEEMIERYYEGTLGNVHKESAVYLLERNIQRSTKYPNRFYFSRDSRLKSFIIQAQSEDITLYATSTLKCPFLFFSSPHCVLYGKIPYFDKFIEVSKKSNPNFVYEIVDSNNHYFHINEPEKVSNILSKFLIENKKIIHKL
ncbi:hypothetical protein PVAND_002104 [Polypedilum vanderplanki]|uniref:AB hydrolase-1 domain-containing protein n=1 Tax=Polypedilum vanderplanki TaxID=319348 RepID=A0A9J6BQE1_POLVA|nr:hypothetical protein PVAND_002104 [Polypedilum vanderplanki]